MAGNSPKHPVIRLYHGEALFQAGQEAKQFYLVRQGCILVLDKAGARTRAVFTGAVNENMPTHAAALPELFSTVLADAGLCKSRGEARRLIQSGAVKVDYGDGKTPVQDTHGSLEKEAVLWSGKKKSVRIVEA